MKTLFFAVDCQQDFMLKGGKLYVKDAEKIIPTLKKLTQFAKNNKIQILATADWHTEDSKEISDTPDFINTFPEHCIRLTAGATFIYETSLRIQNMVSYDYLKLCNYAKTVIGNTVILKDAFDVFKGNPYTEEILKRINPELVVVYGVASDICVNFAVLGLAQRGYNVIVVSDAIKSLPNANMVNIVNQWMDYENVKVLTSDEIMNIIEIQKGFDNIKKGEIIKVKNLDNFFKKL